MPDMPEQKEIEVEMPETEDRSKWSDDQKEHGYYYDDALGYEEFNPDKDEEVD